jgi:uncharacterized membrane protein YphA (DoxX/SURF4 family)
VTTSVENPPRATRRTAGTVPLWALQIVLAAVFAGAGLAKLAGATAVVEMLTDVGAGQWLRFLIGGLELAGAIGLLVPVLAGRAALGLAAVMIGATVTNLVVLDDSPALPFALLC